MEHSAVTPQELERRLAKIHEELSALVAIPGVPPMLRSAVNAAAERVDRARFGASCYRHASATEWSDLTHEDAARG